MDDTHILIVDDEPLTRKSLYEILKYEGYRVNTANDGRQALDLIQKQMPSIVITDLKMPGMDGLSLLKEIRSRTKEVAVVLVTGYGTIDNAVEAMKEGAFDYITKPILDSEIKLVIQRIIEQQKLLEENKFLRQRLADTTRIQFHSLIGQNSQMQKVYTLIETIANTNATVLIQGESGTGKRLIAQAIHESDYSRREKPFIEVSCGALPETLLESELFGHIKGSFTSAIKDREGRFELANGGTIFLDEIDTFVPSLQVKLLRVLQTGEFERVGDTRTMKVDVRVIVATNQDLKELIKSGAFREDLYYRLNVISIHAPALRERKDDIPLLVEEFLKRSNQRVNKKITGISQEAMQALGAYDWPGNIRELENIIERAVILCQGEVIAKEDLPEHLQATEGIQVQAEALNNGAKKTKLLKEALKNPEREIIRCALEQANWNRKKAAENLGINRTTLYNKMKQYGLLNNK
ncbi:MAG: sigma-54 dependent transcriptional regulator [Candidatus Omnitrophota bacterium]|jgi:DNA-binding NtrC family response regulator